MDRISSIFARFDPGRSLPYDVIGHVLPRASVGGGGAVFHDVIPSVSSPQRHHARLPSITKPLSFVAVRAAPEHASPASVQSPAVQQNPLDYLTEASLARRMNNVAVGTLEEPRKLHEAPAQDFTSRSPAPHQPSQAPVCPIDSTAPAKPLPKPTTTRTVPSVKTIQANDPANPKPKRKRIRLKTARRREQCRTNQARYRKKQTEYAKDLEATVVRLRQEIPLLETQHSRLVSNAKSSAWCIVMEYFHIFRNGARISDEIASGPEAWLQKSEAQQQLAFLQSSMSDDVMLGEQRGVNALLEQWKRYTTSFDDLRFQVEHMTRVSEDFIAVTASLTVTISEQTLQDVFPHLLTMDGDRYEEAKAAGLRLKLLGQRLSLPCQLCFEWDEKSKRVVRMEQAVDFLTPVLQVVGTLADAAFVHEHARVNGALL